MTLPRLSEFRNVLQVSPESIANLRDEQLNQLMDLLLRAEAYKYKSPANEVRTNTEIKASDDGCDGWTTKPEKQGGWLGSTNTCWQFKAGVAGEPSNLKNEVSKAIPRGTLLSGGRFVVIASGSKSGIKGENARCAILVEEARAAGLPEENIEVIGSERLKNWCNQHPAVAAYFSGHPSTLWTFEKWARSEVHQSPWQASEAVESKLNELRSKLDINIGEIKHLHIHGLPGVGKTRFALELCRRAEWCNAVVYARQASEISLNELIDDATNNEDVHLMVVADEIETNQLDHLRELVGQVGGRVRLITIGHGKSPDPSRIPSIFMQPLDREVMVNLIKGLYPAMPPEHLEFVVRFSDGFVKLALLVSNAVAGNSPMNVRELLNRDEIRGFLDRMLGSGDRRPLHVVAILSSIGWTGDKQNEGEVVAQHFGLDWNNVRYSVEEFDNKFGIVPHGGRYRYISPTPLGIYLAVEAWNTYPDIVRTLPDVLPSDAAKDAYYERLQSMASNLFAQEFARGELNRFYQLGNFLDTQEVRRWSAISVADSVTAANKIFRALENSTIEERMKIAGEARRHMIWTLDSLSWKSSSFHNATMSLALLAEAENESWSNNATGEFVDRFQIYLGGTATPFQDRLEVLDDLIDIGRPNLVKLALNALSTVGKTNWVRAGSGPVTDELPEREWQPGSNDEYSECIRIAVHRLIQITNKAIPELQGELVTAANSLAMLLRKSSSREYIADLFVTINRVYPQTRESLRRIIAGIIHREKEYWKEISPEDLQEIEDLHINFQESTLEARLLQFIGPETWDLEEQTDLEPIAKELLSDEKLFAQQWSWLTSGDAASGWRLGEILATIDTKGYFAEKMPLFPNRGQDLRLLCAYIKTQRSILGDGWYDNWVETQFLRDSQPITLFFEILSRCGSTAPIARKLVEILHTQKITLELVWKLAYGNWSDNLSGELLTPVLWALFDSGYQEIVVGILFYRLQKNPSEKSLWESLGLHLATNPMLIRSSQMTNMYWKEITTGLIPIHAEEIAAAILKEHNDHESKDWYLQFSDATPILGACITQNPIGSWNLIKGYLSMPNSYRFAFGFPIGMVDRIPTSEVMAWISEDPEIRSKILSGVLNLDFLNDESIASQVLGMYGDNVQIAADYFTCYLSGTWWGKASDHWNELASKLDKISGQSLLSKLRRWAKNSAQYLREMSERDRQREDEENLRV